MKEIGGYIELDTYTNPMLHEDAIALNCGRNALAYLIRSRQIHSIQLPYFICDSIVRVCRREGVVISFYHIGSDFKPTESFNLAKDEWLYLINYYGQIDNREIKEYVTDNYNRVIVDQANAFFQPPLAHVDTLYTCRKWFGVADGAFLYTDSILDEDLPQDESYARMEFLLGRYERTASEFYDYYVNNNKLFFNEPIKKMSKLTMNLLHGVDYDAVRKRREENYKYLFERLAKINSLDLKMASFMYPLMIEGAAEIRRKLQERKVYIPILWPTVFSLTQPDELEYKMVDNILPLPIDQRYSIDDMKYIIQELLDCM